MSLENLFCIQGNPYLGNHSDNTLKQLPLFSWLKPTKNKLTAKKEKGNHAEHLACQYLKTQGLKLVMRNFSISAGEVDLIMLDMKNNDEILVFIEVRYRKNSNFGGAAASVTHKKQQRIIKAALAYQQKHAPQSSMRFDVVAIEGDNVEKSIDKNIEINWIKSAFDGF